MADPVPNLTPFDVVSNRALLGQVVGRLLNASFDQTVGDDVLFAAALPLPDAACLWDEGSPNVLGTQTAVATGRADLTLPWDAPADLSAGSLLLLFPADPPLVVGLCPFGSLFPLTPSEPFACTVQLIAGQSGI